MNTEDKKKKYLQACRIMDMYNKQYNPCKIKISCGKCTCAGIFNYRKELCCKGCSHLTENGCNTNSLGCKLSFCYVGTSPANNGLVKYKSFEEKRFKLLVKIITEYFRENDIPLYWARMSMEDSFICMERKIKHPILSFEYDTRKSVFKY